MHVKHNQKYGTNVLSQNFFDTIQWAEIFIQLYILNAVMYNKTIPPDNNVPCTQLLSLHYDWVDREAKNDPI
jgi:hypothetical protein